jgi:iron complex outermembrane receptor protein
MVYRGDRGTTQFQAIPVAPQNNPLHPGGMIDLARDYAAPTCAGPSDPPEHGTLTLVAGVAYDTLDDTGAATRTSSATNSACRARCAATRTTTSPPRRVPAGLVAVRARWKVEAGCAPQQRALPLDRPLHRPPNGDDSGSADFSATLPVAA